MDSIIRDIRSDIEAIESNTELYEETNFGARVKALDHLEFDVVERIEELLLTNGDLESLASLRKYAEVVRARLERVDLVHLLSGVRTRGLEVEPAYCHYARRCARGLNLSGVEFINVDAREADYSDGTIFFLYTPFEGEMLKEVLGRLKDESRKRSIRLYTYGPCTLLVSQQTWLERVDHNGDRVDRLAIFRTPGSHLL